MTDYQATLQQLRHNLNILQEREAKYAGNAPLELLNQIEDHEQAITLTEQAHAGDLSEAEWQAALEPLLVAIKQRGETGRESRVEIGDVWGDVSGSVIAGRDLSAGGDIVTGVKSQQEARGSHIAQAGPGGRAEVNVFNQQGQQVGTQYNTAGDLNINLILGYLDQPEQLEQLPPALSGRLQAALQDLPQRADVALSEAQRRQAYAAWVVLEEQYTPQEQAARHHYVPLSGQLSLKELPLQVQRRGTLYPLPAPGANQPPPSKPFDDVAQALADEPVLALLGIPGSGKSTVLRRLRLDAARRYLADPDARLPLLVGLADYHGPDPLAFVAGQWRRQGLPGDFSDAARAGRVLLLADGLDEMSRQAGDPAQTAAAWGRFAREYFGRGQPASQIVLAGRRAEYDAYPLTLPRLELEALADDQIDAFISAYLGQPPTELRAALADLDLLKHAGNPYQLAILIELYRERGAELPANRGRLFQVYADWLLAREQDKGHPHWLPLAAQLAALAHLCYRMRQAGQRRQVTAAEAAAWLPARVAVDHRPVGIDPAALLDLARRAGLLNPRQDETTYEFSHLQLQEQFAARQLLAQWRQGDPLAELWRSPRTPAELGGSTPTAWTKLEEPPLTGWEETTILAAGMPDQPAEADGFIRAILAANPPLAGRCLSEGGAAAGEAVKSEVRQTLLAELSDPALHRRARLLAGRVLAGVGDPRFTPVTLNGAALILPPLVSVPGGVATLGSRGLVGCNPLFWLVTLTQERPRHTVELAPFWLGQYPVTNAEYACFIAAGGYQTERYWSESGWRWRQGEQAAEIPEDLRQNIEMARNQPLLLRLLVRTGGWSPDHLEGMFELAKLPDEEVAKRLGYGAQSEAITAPRFWNDSAYQGDNRPVVGVTWYEALAYCAWLAEQIANGEPHSATLRGLSFANGGISQNDIELWTAIQASLVDQQSRITLPSEAEWEWAAGGPEHRRYPWGGRFDKEKANTQEGRVLTTSPVGAYPAGAAACGALDLAGNVWEWTRSIYAGYPYDPKDGREELETGTDVRRVVRGGSWNSSQYGARCAYRNWGDPGRRDFIRGFRVVVAPIAPPSGL